jgi:putative transposase
LADCVNDAIRNCCHLTRGVLMLFEGFRVVPMRSNLAVVGIMPNSIRAHVPGITLHVRQRGNNRCAIFGDDNDYESFLVMLQSATDRYGVDVHGYSLMSTHTHLMLTPSTKEGIAKAIQQLSVRYVLYFNGKYRRIGTLWTGRYRAKAIKDEQYWLTCLRYIEQNPVRAGLVVRPDQYRWSSYRAHAFGGGPEWLVSHPLIESLGANIDLRQAAYREICAVPLTHEQVVRQQLKDQGQTRV